MSTLVLDSLEIKNFRAFQHLRIEKLGWVNLIVGKNNVGKSSVLEALWIYAEQGEPATLYRLLIQRDEITSLPVEAQYKPVNAQEQAISLNALFFGWRDSRQPHDKIHIGSANNITNTVQIDVRWPQSIIKLSETNNEVRISPPLPPELVLEYGFDNTVSIPLVREFLWSGHIIPIGYADYQINYVVSASGMTPFDLARFWDDIALSDAEEDVYSCLRVIAPELQALNFTGSESKDGERVPKVKMSGSSRAIPLRSLGEGMNRMLGIALALVNAKDGMLLIDEVDTGLHYSILPEMWKLIFEVAHRLNVQVFATSHSWDCIQAFQEAAAENKEAEGVLIRLEQRKEGIGAVTFDEQELAIVTREQIEVR